MKQRGVTKRANAFIVMCYQKLLDKELLTQKEAFEKKANEIEGISMSGRTLRKIFNFHQVHVNTYKRSIEQFGKNWILTNNKIDIEDEPTEN
jgi:hypothetical protein